MQLSKHFTLKEMTKSMTAQRRGIDNTPGSGEIKKANISGCMIEKVNNSFIIYKEK